MLRSPKALFLKFFFASMRSSKALMTRPDAWRWAGSHVSKQAAMLLSSPVNEDVLYNLASWRMT